MSERPGVSCMGTRVQDCVHLLMASGLQTTQTVLVRDSFVRSSWGSTL